MFYVIKTKPFMNLHEDCMNSTSIWPLRNSNLIWHVIMSSYSGKSSRRTFMGARDGRDKPQIISRVNHIKWNLWRNEPISFIFIGFKESLRFPKWRWPTELKYLAELKYPTELSDLNLLKIFIWNNKNFISWKSSKFCKKILVQDGLVALNKFW